MLEGLPIILIIGLLFVALFIYFLPALVAGKKKCSTLIFVLNLFFGWSGIGWILCLILAIVME